MGNGVLRESAHGVLRSRGIPTILSVGMPLLEQDETVHRELAEKLLIEWTRTKVNSPQEIREIDCTFMLQRDVPSFWILGHSHPETICDQLHGNTIRRSPVTTCPACCP